MTLIIMTSIIYATCRVFYIVMLNLIIQCHYAECHYAEFHGALYDTKSNVLLWPSKRRHDTQHKNTQYKEHI
jgi:hypothetical protein